MEELNWLADLASDCVAFGEEHGLEHIEEGAQALIDALERDFGLRFSMLPRVGRNNGTFANENLLLGSNVLLFPIRCNSKSGDLKVMDF